MGFLLYIISLVMKRLLEPFIYIFGSIIALTKGEWNQYNTDLAIATDQYGNGLSKYLFNMMLIKKESTHKFGNIDETISSVIGKNKVAGTLTWLGTAVDIMLDSLDPDHSIKAIDNTEN
jgi:hypothetical protein